MVKGQLLEILLLFDFALIYLIASVMGALEKTPTRMPCMLLEDIAKMQTGELWLYKTAFCMRCYLHEW